MPRALATGKLNTLGTIEQRTPGKDAANRPLPGYVPFLTLYADVSSFTGLGALREAEGAIPDGGSTYSIRVRYRPNAGITEGMRFNIGNTHYFDIKKILHDFKGKQWTDLVCVYGAGNG